MLITTIHTGDPKEALEHLERQDPNYIGDSDDDGAVGFEMLKNALGESKSVIVK